MNKRSVVASAAAMLAAAGLAQAQSFTQAFDDIVSLTASGGWFTQNNSSPIGGLAYFQGNTTVFAPHASTGYLGVNYNSGGGLATISNWFVTPVLSLQNGQTFSFYTRTVDAPAFPDRLQVRMSLANTSTNVGTAATDVGDFTNLLLDINPTYTTAGYPNVWTQYVITISGVPAATNGRLAFRYFVENGGPSGANSDYIGIDTAEYVGTAQPTGACCISLTGACVDSLTSNACVSQGGVYQGNGSTCGTITCPQPPTGACCINSGTGCVTVTQTVCTSQGGVFQGNGTNCATAGCPVPCPPNTGALPNGPSTWPSTHGTQNGRLFRDGVADTCAAPGVPGTPIAGSYAYDKYDYVNNAATATCVLFDINTACTGTNFIYAGAYVGTYDPNNPVLNNVASIGGSPNPTASMSFSVPAGAAFSIVVAEVTAGAGCPAYTFTLGGGALSCSPSTASCYANCDNSTITPCLNVNDFICFNNAYSAGSAYANCDASTIAPVLNVNDFICFNNKYSAGCATPCSPHP